MINGILALSFGLVILFKNWRNKANWLFFLMTIAVAVWSFGYWRWYSIYDSGERALFWVRILSIGSLFIPVFYLHWTSLFLSLEKRLRHVIHIAYIAAFAILPFTFSELFIRDIEPKLFFPFWPNPGFLYNFYLAVVYVGLVIFSLFVLLKEYRVSPPARKGQIFYVVLGAILGFGGGATNFFLWYNVPVPPYGNFLVAVFPFLLGYAALKHGLFNIKVITAELVTFSLWIFLLTRFLIGRSPEEKIIDGTLLVLVVLAGIFLIRGVLEEVRSREEIERLARSLEAANRELKKLDQLKSEFVSMVSHQLRTPLTATKGYLSMALEGAFGAIPEELRDRLSRIYQSNERLTRFVNDILNLARIERDKIEYTFKEINLGALLKGVLEEAAMALKQRGLASALNVAGDLPRIEGDEEKLRQVFSNLLDNAIRYTPSGKIEISASPKGKQVWVAIKDTGVGMSREDMGRIFDKFSRGKDASRVSTEGTGIGLYVAKRIAEDHGGKIRAESEGKGKGSIFWVELPIPPKAISNS